jgi:hypothetical protein
MVTARDAMRAESVMYCRVEAGLRCRSTSVTFSREARPWKEVHGAAATEAVSTQPCDVDPHRREGVRRQGQEDVALDSAPQVRQTVQSSVLPLPVDGQAVDRQTELV